MTRLYHLLSIILYISVYFRSFPVDFHQLFWIIYLKVCLLYYMCFCVWIYAVFHVIVVHLLVINYHFCII